MPKATAAGQQVLELGDELQKWITKMHNKGYSDIAMATALITVGDCILKHGTPWSPPPARPN